MPEFTIFWVMGRLLLLRAVANDGENDRAAQAKGPRELPPLSLIHRKGLPEFRAENSQKALVHLHLGLGPPLDQL